MIRVMAAILLVGLSGVLMPAAAQKVVPGPDSDVLKVPRYRFSHTADGVMRLDSQTGQVTLCKPRDGTFVCNPAPEESAQLKVELKEKSDQFNQLKTEISQLQAQLSDTRADTAAPADDTLKEDVASLKAALAQKSEQIGKLGDEIATLKSQIAEAGARPPAADLSPLRDAIATLKAEIGALKDKVAALDKNAAGGDRLDELVPRVAILEQNAGGVSGALTRLEKQSAALEQKIEAQNKNLQQQIAAIPAPPDVKPDLSRLDVENSALKGEVATLSADVAALKDRIATLSKAATTQDQVAVQRAQIERLAMENASLKDEVASLKTETAALQQKLAALAPPPAPKPPAGVPAPKDQQLNLPSSADIARARAALAEAWRRMVEMIDNLRRDMTRKDDGSVRL